MAEPRLTPIVDADGRPYYVTERDYIGAEHINAQAAWTRLHHAVATREHDEDGRHNTWVIPKATIILRPSGPVASRVYKVDPRTRIMGRSWRDDHSLLDVVRLGGGYCRLTLGIPLPHMDFVIAGHTDGESSHTLGGSSRVRVRITLASRISTTQFEIFRESSTLADGPIAFSIHA